MKTCKVLMNWQAWSTDQKIVEIHDTGLETNNISLMENYAELTRIDSRKAHMWTLRWTRTD